METYISFSKWRRSEWKGHDNAKSVRSAIRYARAHSTELTIYVREVTSGDQVVYVEIPEADWLELFFPTKR